MKDISQEEVQYVRRRDQKPRKNFTLRPQNDKKFDDCKYCGRQHVQFVVVTGNVQPILGSEAIQRMKLITVNKVNIHNDNISKVDDKTENQRTDSTVSVVSKQMLEKQYPDVFKGEGKLPGKLKRDNQYVMRIKPFKNGKEWTKAKVDEKCNIRSYNVTTEDGSTYRRNRRHLILTKEPMIEQSELDLPTQTSTDRTDNHAQPIAIDN
ncbi:unnamed protein product [Mytilus edulis]|uniref:Uncharacterized protein n=1 Tax=Mytilus edulis TaxID=6550 RepID=A0A8S3PVB1_MYTED|nr:unnamed protein product [Mytilus edulis]